jgi:glycosyltransferase involved in cell wall biosynthesis
MKKKVLFLIEDISFTFDNRVIRETQALIEKGWDVTVVCPKDPVDPFYRRDSDRLRTYFYPKQDASTVPGHVIEHSITILAVTLLTWFAFLRHGFRVIHACNPMDIFWIPSLPFKLFGVRYIFDHHDLSPELYLCRGEGSKESAFFRILLWLEKMSFRFSNVVIATNESYKKIALERGGKSSGNVFVVRNGPNLDKFKLTPPRTDLKADGEVLVGYLGNMNPQDGVDYLLRAAVELVIRRGLKHIKFVLVGGGSYRENLDKMSLAMGLTPWLSFTGRIPDDAMLATLSACDLCVQPDPRNPLNDKSTMNKVMEYMALAKPVVAFDLTETRVSCGEAALYAEPNSEVDLADKILELADNPELRLRMGEQGRKRVERELAWPYSVPALLAAYEQATA